MRFECVSGLECTNTPPQVTAQQARPLLLVCSVRAIRTCLIHAESVVHAASGPCTCQILAAILGPCICLCTSLVRMQQALRTQLAH